MYKYSLVLLFFMALFLTACDRIYPFETMGKDLTDTVKYSERMSMHILDIPECTKFKSELQRIGKAATSMDGTFMHLIVKTKDAANKAGCNKS